MKLPAGHIDRRQPVEWDHPLNAGLVSWWLPFGGWQGGGTLRDLCRRNHGTLTNGPTWEPGPNGFGAVSFDGSDDYVDLGAAQFFSTSAPFTAEFDVYMADTNTNTIGTFNAGSFGLNFGYVNFGGGYQGWSLGDASWQPQQDGRTGRGNARYHVVYTYTGAGVSSASNYGIYENGVPGTVVNSGSYGSQAAVNYLGHHTGSDDWFGRIHSVRFFNRALSAAEVAALYDQSLRGYPDLLRRVPTRRWFVGAGGPAATAFQDDSFQTDAFQIVGGGGYTLAVDGASVAVTPAAVTLRATRTLPVAGASVSVTGGTVALRVSRLLSVTGVNVAVTPTAVGVRVTRTLPATPASVSVTGGTVGLLRNYPLPVTGASVSITGGTVGIRVERKLSVTAASLALTGSNVGLSYSGAGDKVLTVQAAAVTITAGQVGVTVARRLPVTAAAVAVTAGTVGMTRTRVMAATPAAVAVTPAAVGLRVGRTLPVAPANVTLSGGEVGVGVSRLLPVAGANVTITAAAVGLRADRRLVASGANVTITPGDVTLTYSGAEPPVPRAVFRVPAVTRGYRAEPVGRVYPVPAVTRTFREDRG